MPDAQVLIVGAGPTGLVLGCDLARRGVRVRIVDQAGGPAVGSRGKGLQPRSVELLDDLGVRGRVLAVGRSTLPLLTWDGAVPGAAHELNADVVDDPSRPFNRTMLIAQTFVEAALRDRLEDLGGEIEYGSHVTAFDDLGTHVRVHLQSEAGTAVGAADWLVGCDGAGSVVRRGAGIGFLGETDEEDRLLVGDLQLDGLDRDHWHLWPRSSGALLALCPLPALDLFQIQMTVPPEVHEPPTLEALDREVREWSGLRDVRVRSAPWLSVWRSNKRLVDRYQSGRVLLAGDAAHVHPPAGGLGMNTGMQDAWNLGWKLAAHLHGAPGALLDTYAAERMPVAAAALGFSSDLMAGGAAGVVAEGQAADTLQLDLSYRGGPLAADPDDDPDDGPQVRAGDRAPDAPLTDGDGAQIRLFDTFRGPAFRIVRFLARDDRSEPAVSVLRVGRLPDGGWDAVDETVLFDTSGAATRAYQAVGPASFVVRPDGYLLARLATPDVGPSLDTITTVLGGRGRDGSR